MQNLWSKDVGILWEKWQMKDSRQKKKTQIHVKQKSLSLLDIYYYKYGIFWNVINMNSNVKCFVRING